MFNVIQDFKFISTNNVIFILPRNRSKYWRVKNSENSCNTYKQLNISQNTTVSYVKYYFRATCFDYFESSSGPSRNRSKFINVYGTFWDSDRLQHGGTIIARLHVYTRTLAIIIPPINIHKLESVP